MIDIGLSDTDLHKFCSSLHDMADVSASQVVNVSGRRLLMIVKTLAKIPTVLNHSGYFNDCQRDTLCVINCFVSSAQNVAFHPHSCAPETLKSKQSVFRQVY